MKKTLVLGITLMMFILACNGTVLPPAEGCDTVTATYSSNVKSIIDQTCAYSGCHDGASRAPGNYSSMEGLRGFLDDGSFVSRVIDQQSNPSRGMPPNASVYPESQQDDLSSEQMEIIQCWIDGGFEE